MLDQPFVRSAASGYLIYSKSFISQWYALCGNWIPIIAQKDDMSRINNSTCTLTFLWKFHWQNISYWPLTLKENKLLSSNFNLEDVDDGQPIQRVLQYTYPMQNKGVFTFNKFMTSIVIFNPVLKFWLCQHFQVNIIFFKDLALTQLNKKLLTW